MKTTLSAALLAAYSAAVQKPAWLVQVNFATPLRYSSHGTVSYGGQTFTEADVDVSRARVAGLRVDGQLLLGNADDAAAALVLNEGVAGRQILIYGFDAAATSADADFVPLVNCIGGRATITPTQVAIELKESTAHSFTPREYVRAPAFTHLVPAGQKYTINGQTYTIERR